VKYLISYILICNIGESLIDRLKSNIVTTLLTTSIYVTGVRQDVLKSHGPDLPLLFKLHEIRSVDSQESH